MYIWRAYIILKHGGIYPSTSIGLCTCTCSDLYYVRRDGMHGCIHVCTYITCMCMHAYYTYNVRTCKAYDNSTTQDKIPYSGYFSRGTNFCDIRGGLRYAKI